MRRYKQESTTALPVVDMQLSRRQMAGICAAVTLAGSSQATAANTASLVRDAMAATQHACDAFRRSDVAAVQKWLRPDFTLVNSSGEVQPLSELLDEIRSGAITYEVFRNHSMSALLFDDIAMVRGITSLRGKHHDAAFGLELRFTDILESSSGYWRMITSHVTRLPATGTSGGGHKH